MISGPPWVVLGLPAGVLAGIAACTLALVLAVVTVVEPGRVHLSASRRRPPSSLIDRTTTLITGRMGQALAGRDLSTHVAVLGRAGVKMPFPAVVLAIGAGATVAGVAGWVVDGPLFGLLLGVLVPVLVRVVLGLKASRRRTAFVNQLEGSLQLMASSLRSGQSFLQALTTVARDSPEPSREEFTRVLNESRVGRDVGQALDEAAVRMASADLVWVAEAIAINREVGGNLALILDRVTDTIRERGQVRRQVAVLSSEGRISAFVLMALPVGIAGFLAVASPEYIGRLTQSPLGWAMVGVSATMLLLGGLWLRKLVRIAF
jgi:tight adherence protein B